MAAGHEGSNGAGSRPPAGYRPAWPRRTVDVAGLGRRGAGPEAAAPNLLTIARAVQVSGEIGACDHLVVQGRLEGRVVGCHSLEIAASGHFQGEARVEMAVIAGRFEGELAVTGRLVVQDGGSIAGTTRYGQLVVEAGGRLQGQLTPLDGATVTALPDRSGLPPPRHPLRGPGA